MYLKVHYWFCKSLPFVPILHQMNSVQTTLSCFFKIHFNITLPSVPRSSMLSFFFQFPHKFPVCNLHIDTSYMHCPSYPPWIQGMQRDMWTNMTPLYVYAFTHCVQRLDRNCFRHNTVYLRICWLSSTLEQRLLHIVFNFSFLQSLLMCLRESHRTRTVFRKVGGFVYVMSVLVSMEGCLRGEPASPWNEIPVSQVLNLLHMVFNTVTVAMRFEPANAKFFHQEVSVVLPLKWKHKRLNPQPRFFVQDFQNVASFCRLILAASMLLTGLVLYYVTLGWFI